MVQNLIFITSDEIDKFINGKCFKIQNNIKHIKFLYYMNK